MEVYDTIITAEIIETDEGGIKLRLKVIFFSGGKEIKFPIGRLKNIWEVE